MTSIYTEPATRRAVSLLRDYTSGSFDVFQLVGRSNADARQQVVTAILNLPKPLPKAQCGITILRHHLISAMKIEGDCIAVRNRNLTEQCKQLLAD